MTINHDRLSLLRRDTPAWATLAALVILTTTTMLGFVRVGQVDSLREADRAAAEGRSCRNTNEFRTYILDQKSDSLMALEASLVTLQAVPPLDRASIPGYPDQLEDNLRLAIDYFLDAGIAQADAQQDALTLQIEAAQLDLETYDRDFPILNCVDASGTVDR